MLPVGTLKPNDWGFFDMLGNALDWTQSIPFNYLDRLKIASEEGVSNVEDIKDTQIRVLRGGSFFSAASFPRSAHRERNVPTNSGSPSGFRVARTITP